MGRSLYVIAYDIGDATRQRKVRERLTHYRVSGQKSCFECWLTLADLQRLLTELAGLIKPDADRLHCVSLDPRMQILCAGQAKRFNPQYFQVF